MGMFDKVKSKTKEFQDKQAEKQKQNAETRLVKQEHQQKVKEGEAILKSIMGSNLMRNVTFTQRMRDHGISSFKVSTTWGKMNKQIKSELQNGTLQPENVSERIDELLIEYGNPEKMQKNAEKAERNAIKAQQQAEIQAEKDRQKAMQLGVIGYDFKCQLHEQRVSTLGNVKEDIIDGYCFVEEDKLTIKKISIFLKSQMGDKIIPYANINAIDYDKAGAFHITSSIVISTTGFDAVVLKHTTEENFQLLYEAWLNFNTKPNEQQVTNETPQTSNADELIKYAQLYKEGLLTEEEFEAKKKELL